MNTILKLLVAGAALVGLTALFGSSSGSSRKEEKEDDSNSFLNGVTDALLGFGNRNIDGDQDYENGYSIWSDD